MKVNGKSKTPITAAQAKKNNGESGGTKARTSQQTSKKKLGGVKTAVLDRISDGILAFDAGMNYTYLNERAGELLGRSADELIGKNLEEEYSGAGRTPFMEACQRALETQSVVWLNEYFPATDRWLEGQVYPSEDGVSVLFKEGSGQKAMEQDRIREASMFPEQNPNPVMRLTTDGGIVYANQASGFLLATWEQQQYQAESFLKIRERLQETLETGSNQQIEIENQGRVFNCLLVPFAANGYVNVYFQDITERKQAEEALRAIVNQASAGIVRTDLQAGFTFVNQAFCDMLGYSESELTRLSIWDITDKEILEKNKRLFEHMLATGEGYQLEKRLIRRDGSMFWVSMGTSALRDADGHIRGATSVTVDITRRKRAEESLLDSARRSLFLSSLSDTIRSIENPSKIQVEAACLVGAHLKASRVAYVEVDPEDRFLVQDHYVDGVPEMEGEFSISDFVPLDQLLKFRAGRLFNTSDVKKDARFHNSQRSKLVDLSIQAQLIVPFARDGRVVAALLIQQSQPRVWMDAEVSLVEEAAERMQAAIERAQVEGRLHDSEKRFRILANAVPSIVWTSTLDGRLLYVNDRWYDFTGIDGREATPSWTDLKLHPDDAPNFFREMRAIKSSLSEAVTEVRIQRQDGVYRWFQTRSVPTMDESGMVTAWHGVLTDIHDRVEKDAEQRKIIDSTPFMLARCSRDLRYLFVSGAYAEMIGRTPEQVIGRTIVDVMGEQGFEAIRTYIDQVLQGQRVEFEAQVPFKDFNTPFLHVIYTPEQDEQGNIVGWFASIVDLTERRRMEDFLRDSERKFNILFNKLPFTAVLLQPEDNTIVDVNEEFETVFGYTRQDAIGKTTSALGIDSDPGDRAYILAQLQANVAIRDMELQFRTKSQGLRTFLINTDTVAIGGNNYVLQTAQDITDRKHAEATIRASEEKYRRIVETANEGIWEIDKEARTIFVNARMAEMLGYRVDEMIGRSSFEFVFPEDQVDGEKRMVRARGGTPARSNEFKFRCKDGSALWTLVSSSPQLDEQGNFIGSFAMAMDITERKKAEEALRTSEERMRLAIESNRMVAWEWDPQADRVTTSDNFSEIYGLASVNSAAEGFSLIWPEDLPPHRARVDQVLSQGGEYRSEFRITRPVDGQTVWLEERAIALTDNNGQVTRLVGVVIDITERKRAEQELAEFARQQEALYKLADELSSAGSLEEMFNPALDAILSALQCDRASILLFDEQDVMSFVAWRGLSDEYRRLTNGHSPWTRGEQNARPIDMEDVATADLSDSLRATVQAEGIGALAFIPLISRGNLIGKFMVYFNKPHKFEEAQIGLAQTIAHQLASHIERKRAAEELRQSKQRLSLTYHHAPIGIVETTLDGRFLEVNDELCRMLGYTYDELSRLGIADVTPRDYLQREQALYQQMVDGIIPSYRMEKQFIKKDGGLLWGEVVRTMVHDEDGRPLYGIGGVLNVTERKQREEELRARTEEIEALMEVNPIGIFFAHDPECSFITANPAGYHLVEMPEDSTGNVSKSAPGDERPTYRTFRNGVELKPADLPMQKAARLGMEIEEETLEMRFENGAQKYIYAYAKPLFDAQGKTRGTIAAMLDITQRMQREEELRARTEEIETLMEVSPIGIMVAHDPECNQITGNPAANVILGLPQHANENLSNPVLAEKGQAHWVYRDGVELAVPDLPMQVAARLGVEVKDETLELRFEDGSKKYIYLYARPLFDTQNKARGAIAALLDVTERRRSEQAMRESEERFSKAFRVSPDAVTISRLSDGRIMEINNSWSTLLGYDPEEAVGKTSLELNIFANPEARSRAVDLLKQQGSVRDFEVDVRQKSGEIRHALLAVESIEINGVECLISIMRDITERKRAEETLRQSEERFARFMLHLPGLAWIKDIQGRYVFVNAEAQKAFNASQEQLYGKTDGEVFPPEIAAQFNRNDNLAVLEEKGIQVVETMPQVDGVVHHSLVTKFPIPGPDGRPTMIGGTAFDITERIEMEEALQLARTQAEKTAYRVTQLQKITAALSQAATTSEIARMVVEQGAPVVGAMGSSILLLNEENQAMEMMYSSMEDAVVRPFASFPLSVNVPTSDAVKSGQPVWIASQEEFIRRYPHMAENIQNWGLEAALVFPMIYKGHVLGALSLGFSQPRPFSLEDQDYLLTLARQAAQAIERARVETALRLDAAMIENVPAGIYLVRANNGIILHTNPQLDKLFGYEPGEIIGKPVSVLNAPNGRSPQEVANGIIEILHQKGSWQGEVLSIRKDGTRFWCSASVTTFEHDTYGTVWVAARQDITERKRIEEALRESEQRSSAIVSQATAGIVRKDESGRLLFVNQAFCDMLGMSDAELVGRRIWEFTHPEDVSENKRLYSRLIAEGIPFHLEKRLINKHGSVLWVNVSVSPVVDVSGKPNSAVSVYVDITGRKLAEKRLSLLVRVSELAREVEDPDELMYAVAQAVGEHFQARRTLFNEIDLENNLEIIHRDYCIGVESVAGEHPITDYSSITTAEMIAGKTVVNRDSKLDPRTAADYERSYVEHGERAYVTVPLMQDGRWVASLWLSDDKPRDWDREDVSLLETIAERTWIAIEKMRVDRALRASEERLRVTFNTTVVGFATLTPETNFVDVNDAYCRIVGYSRQELLKLNSESLTHPDFIEETRRHVAQLLAGEVPDFTLEKIYIRRDGTEIWVQNSVSIVRDESGDPLHLIAICQDITDRKRSEKALQESNQRYQTLVEISPYAIFVNKDGRIVFANNECVRLLGAESLEQVIGRSNFDFLHPDYHDIVRERNKQLMQGNQDLPSLEEKIIRFDGEIVDVEISASPFIEQGEPAILVTMNNITERKRAEEALHQLNLELEERVKRRTIELQVANEFLRESEATSRLILESMPDAIVIIDRDGQIVHANTQVETLFGYAPGEVMGQPVESLVPQRLRAEHEQQRFSYGEGRNRRIMGLGQELFGRRKDESEFPVEVMLAPIDNSTNWDVLVAIRDNTRQRQAQEALRTNEEKLRTLFEILPVGISFLGKDGRVNELNSALAEILELPRREILAGSFRSRRFIRTDGTPMPSSEFASTRARVEQKTIYNVETGIVKDDGEIIWTSVNAAPVQVADVEAVVVTIDITERKKAEEALHRNRERLRILSRRLVEVQEEERHAIARELHDRVGQNLAALTLNLNILRNQLSGEILDKVGTRLNDSVTLVNDILTITRSVMADLRPNVLDDYGLDAAINEYAERFTQRYGIRVITHTPVKATPRLDPGVEMTLLRIAQEALTNIAKHAQASQAVMSLEMEDDAVLMTIEDNGQGIMSWQKVNQPGSHGLRIMRERAEAFGGSLKIHSTYKNGTKIEVKIPMASSVPTTGRKEKK